MKILCLIDSLGSGGAQRQLVLLARGFVEAGHEVHFLVYHQDHFFSGHLADGGVEEITIVEPRPIRRIMKIRSFIRSGGFDAVVSFLETPSLIACLSALPCRKWKLVVGERSANPGSFHFGARWLKRLFFFASDFIVANSHANAMLLCRAYPFFKKKVKVVYNIVEDRFLNKSSLPQHTDENAAFSLVVLASHQWNKNLSGLVEAVAQMSFRYRSRLAVHWYGSERGDESRERGVALIEAYGLGDVFTFHPPEDDVLPIIGRADALGLFSFIEGLPNAVCEAMALGKPVVCSRVSDLPLIVDGRFVFDPSAPERIAEVLCRIMEAPRRDRIDVGNQNRERAKALFSARGIVSQYLGLLSSTDDVGKC